MIRKIVHIDEELCNGCGICAEACHEGAIGMVDGKAKLLRDDYCDGLGDCLPTCPTGAIKIIEREAEAFDAEAVKANMAARAKAQGQEAKVGGCPGKMARSLKPAANAAGGCPGKMVRSLNPAGNLAGENPTQAGPARSAGGCPGKMSRSLHQPGQGHHAGCPGKAARQIKAQGPGLGGCQGAGGVETPQGQPMPSRLAQWPVQIKLAPINAEYFNGADLLIAADCCAFAYGNFHNDFMNGKVTIVGCPKLDSVDYSEKLAAIIGANDIKSVTVTRMEVPCCGGMEMAVRKALAASGKDLDLKVVTISLNGEILKASE